MSPLGQLTTTQPKSSYKTIGILIKLLSILEHFTKELMTFTHKIQHLGLCYIITFYKSWKCLVPKPQTIECNNKIDIFLKFEILHFYVGMEGCTYVRCVSQELGYEVDIGRCAIWRWWCEWVIRILKERR